jgi:enoyl-CoA hydratase/carnithine racemase
VLVEVALDGDVATLTLNRPEARNALSAELCDALAREVKALPGEVRAVVLAGEGKVFCSGADLAAVSGPAATAFLPSFERMLETVARCRPVTVAAIHGAALGGGFQLATVCDFRVIAEDAALGIPSASLGIVVNLENVQRLVLLVGIARAKEILLAGARFSGAESDRYGFATEIVPASETQARARALAERVAALAPLSVQSTKRAVQAVSDALADVRAARPEEAAVLDELVARAYASADLQEGLRAVAERRPPRFEGR